MRHRKVGRQLRRSPEQRLSLLRNLAQSLIQHGAIETTEAKAKELRPFVEKLITVNDKLFHEVAPRFATRQGGYTRILKTGHRKGDGAEMARIELMPETK